MNRTANILVVDDEAMTRTALCECLTDAGYRVRAAASGAEGLAALAASSDLDLMLLDLGMPEMDGFEVLRRHRDGQGRAAVVILSGLAEIESVVKAMKLGAADYLSKPFQPTELDLVLRRTLASRTLDVAAPSPSRERATPL